MLEKLAYCLAQEIKRHHHLYHSIPIFAVYQHHLSLLSVIPHPFSTADIQEAHYMDSLTPQIQGEVLLFVPSILSLLNEGSQA